jgi:hypothetical protein
LWTHMSTFAHISSFCPIYPHFTHLFCAYIALFAPISTFCTCTPSSFHAPVLLRSPFLFLSFFARIHPHVPSYIHFFRADIPLSVSVYA